MPPAFFGRPLWATPACVRSFSVMKLLYSAMIWYRPAFVFLVSLLAFSWALHSHYWLMITQLIDFVKVVGSGALDLACESRRVQTVLFLGIRYFECGFVPFTYTVATIEPAYLLM